MVVNGKIAPRLAELGLSDYEARAYVALLQQQPATAYELSQLSGIPSSKIYEVLNRLQEKGVVQLLAEGGGRSKSYAALDPDEFLERKRREVADCTNQLAPLLRQLGKGAGQEQIWTLNESQAVLDKARRMIESARETLLISLWPKELVALESALRTAEAREVRIALVHFGVPESHIGATFHHPVERTLYEEKGGRGLTLVVDGYEVLIATFRDDGSVEGAWSRHRAFVTVAEDYVRHDVYITKVTATLGKALRKQFGEDYEQLRDVFSAVE